ncbi:MAG: hypothetical protein IJ086_03480 [Clostridium sp.]|nr:hypothetical protein [Clostridium sp.]
MINGEMILSAMTSSEVIKITVFGGGLIASSVVSNVIKRFNVKSRTDIELIRKLFIFGTYTITTTIVIQELIELLNNVSTMFYLH